jgi:hypothetical protein
MIVSWDDYSQYMAKTKNIPNHQPVYVYIYIITLGSRHGNV